MQGCLAHKKPPHSRTLQQGNAQGPMVVLGGVAVSDERDTPVAISGQGGQDSQPPF